MKFLLFFKRRLYAVLVFARARSEARIFCMSFSYMPFRYILLRYAALPYGIFAAARKLSN